MKRVLLIIFLLSTFLITQSVFASQPDSIYVYQEGSNEVYRISAYTYDSDGRIATEKVYDDTNGDGLMSWEEDYEYSYTRENDNLITEKISYSLYNSVRTPGFKQVIISNSHGNKIEEYNYSYSQEEKTWEILSHALSNEFNNKNNPIVVYDTIFQFNEISKYEYTYDANDLPATIKEYLLTNEKKETIIKTAEDHWTLSSDYVYKYNSNGKLLEEVYTTYEKGEVLHIYTKVFAYDKNNDVQTEIHTENGSEILKLNYTYVYSESPTSITPVKTTNLVSVYPNPVTDYIYIDIKGAKGATVRLINAFGSLIKYQTVQQQLTTIQVSSLPKGYYILHISTDTGSESHKLIIR